MKDGKVVLARVHLEADRVERFPVGGLADLVKRYGLHTQAQECIWVISHDRAGTVHTINEVARGDGDQVALDLPGTLTAVLAAGAPAFSVAHNHPTMDPTPSYADRQLTNTLMEAANSVGLLFEDHVIVEPTGRSFSFRDAGLIIGVNRPGVKAAAPRRRK